MEYGIVTLAAGQRAALLASTLVSRLTRVDIKDAQMRAALISIIIGLIGATVLRYNLQHYRKSLLES